MSRQRVRATSIVRQLDCCTADVGLIVGGSVRYGYERPDSDPDSFGISDVEIGLGLKSSASAKPLFIASLANDYIGYIATDDALTTQGGYETWASLWALGGVGTAPAMEELALGLMDRLWKEC